MNKAEVSILIDEKGKLDIHVAKGTPFIVALGMLELAKVLLIEQNGTPADKPQPNQAEE